MAIYLRIAMVTPNRTGKYHVLTQDLIQKDVFFGAARDGCHATAFTKRDKSIENVVPSLYHITNLETRSILEYNEEINHSISDIYAGTLTIEFCSSDKSKVQGIQWVPILNGRPIDAEIIAIDWEWENDEKSPNELIRNYRVTNDARSIMEGLLPKSKRGCNFD